MQPSVLTPPPIATEAFNDAAAAVARLDEIYQRNTRFLCERFEAYARGEVLAARVRATYPFVRISTTSHARLDFAARLRLCREPGRARDQRDAARPVPQLSHGADRTPDREPPCAGRDRRVERADPCSFRLPPRHQYRGRAHRRRNGGRTAAARRLRHARSRRHGRRDRQRHAATATRRARAARAVSRVARRLFVAPALPLHRHRSGALPELRDLHELSVLRRCLRAPVRRADASGSPEATPSWSPAT